MIDKLPNIDQSELDAHVWRYLNFPKFISLITYQALWFAKLNILQDQFEGTLPSATKEEMHQNNQQWKPVFNTPEFHRQIDNWPDDNVRSGRELTVVNCWFLDEAESKDMWANYVGNNEGVAICSSIRRLSSSVNAYPEFSLIGKVKYVEFNNHLMGMYEAHQADERALLKDKRYQLEQEVRIVTMNLKTPWCLNMNGTPLSKEEYTGKNMNNFENKGLYITVNLQTLIESVVLAPGAGEWFELLVKQILKLSNINCPVTRSAIDEV